ncbi:hypothetical protein [Pedobacter sp.]|uniref:hypothetical protein n=1 Tax=Pedobacter sp. TaxID=1411316 RepID=UPI003BA9393F
MNAIETLTDYRKAILRINTLLNKGSQGVSGDEMTEIRILRQAASDFEKIRYDHSENLGAIQQEEKA